MDSKQGASDSPDAVWQIRSIEIEGPRSPINSWGLFSDLDSDTFGQTEII